MSNQIEIKQLLEQAQAASRSGDSAKAQEIADKIIAIDPKNAEAYYIRGSNERFDSPKAESFLRRAIEINPSYIDARMALAERYIRSSSSGDKTKIDKAIEEYTYVIQFFPQHSQAYRRRGYLYDRKNSLDLAKEDFSKAIDLTPDDASLYITIGSIFLKEKKYNEVLANINHALSLNSKNYRILHLIDSAFKEKPDFMNLSTIEKIVEEYEQHTDFDITSSSVDINLITSLILMYKRLALIYAEHEKYQDFIDKYKASIDKVKAIGVTDAEIHYLLGIAYGKLGQNKNALSEFDNALRKQHDHTAASEERSKVLLSIIERQENDFQTELEGFLSGPESIFGLRDKFLEREKECVARYRNITKWIGFSFFFTFLTIASGIVVLGWWVNQFTSFSFIDSNPFSLLPYIAVLLLFTAVPVWWTRILLKSRDRWQVLQEDCFRKAAIMQYLQATGSDTEFRNHIILETIKHMANRSGADLLVALHSDDPGMLYSATDIMEKIIKK